MDAKTEQVCTRVPLLFVYASDSVYAPQKPESYHYFGNVALDWGSIPTPGIIVPQKVYVSGPGSNAGSIMQLRPGILLTDALQLAEGQGFDGRLHGWKAGAKRTIRLLVRHQHMCSDPFLTTD